MKDLLEFKKILETSPDIAIEKYRYLNSELKEGLFDDMLKLFNGDKTRTLQLGTIFQTAKKMNRLQEFYGAIITAGGDGIECLPQLVITAEEISYIKDIAPPEIVEKCIDEMLDPSVPTIDIGDLEYFKDFEDEQKRKVRTIEIKNVSFLPMERLKEIQKEFPNLATIETRAFYNYEYDVQTYARIREEIDSILSTVEMQGDQMSTFMQIIQRLSHKISYDYGVINDEENKIETNRSATSRNLIGGLLEGKCVCAGYAEIMRNILPCVGMEAVIVRGNDHAWNQVKINDEWFNMDLTWDRDRIVRGEEPVYLLKSDADFKDHSLVEISPDKKIICARTIETSELQKYLGIERLTGERILMTPLIDPTNLPPIPPPITRDIETSVKKIANERCAEQISHTTFEIRKEYQTAKTYEGEQKENNEEKEI